MNKLSFILMISTLFPLTFLVGQDLLIFDQPQQAYFDGQWLETVDYVNPPELIFEDQILATFEIDFDSNKGVIKEVGSFSGEPYAKLIFTKEQDQIMVEYNTVDGTQFKGNLITLSEDKIEFKFEDRTITWTK